MHLPSDPAVSLLGRSLSKTNENICPQNGLSKMFALASFIIAPICKQRKCSSTSKQLNCGIAVNGIPINNKQ